MSDESIRRSDVATEGPLFSSVGPESAIDVRLEDLNRGFFQGVARLVHDLNSPLTALQTAIDLLENEMRSNDSSTARSELELALSSLDSLGKLISSWQGVLQRESPTPSKVDALDILTSGLERIQMNHPEIPVNCTPSLPPGEDTRGQGWEMETEPFAFDHILALLLNNAVEAVEGVEKPTIHVSLQQTPQEFTLLLDNNGPIVPEEIRNTLWRDFVTTKEGHFGLGLGVVRYLLMRHGGSIQLAESSLGGTAFKVTIRRRMYQRMAF